MYSSRAPTFSTHMPCSLKICFTNKVNTICGGDHLLATGSLGPITRVLGVRVPCPRVASPKAQGTSSIVLGFRVLGLRSQGPGFRVSGPDFRLCPAKPLLDAMTVYEMNIFQTLCFVYLCKNGNTPSIFKYIYTLKPINKY